MTAEERLARIEHLTAGIAEERRKDREESKALWRDTRRQINEIGLKLSEAGSKLVQLSEADSRLEARIELAEESRAADKRLKDRILSLVSSSGEFIARGPRT